jgi:hypothetical protein
MGDPDITQALASCTTREHQAADADSGSQFVVLRDNILRRVLTESVATHSYTLLPSQLDPSVTIFSRNHVEDVRKVCGPHRKASNDDVRARR